MLWSGHVSAGGAGRGSNMADEAGEVNTAVEDGEEKQPLHEPEGLSGAAADDESGGSDGQDRTERSAPAVTAENSWSAPIVSLARKATETISSGVSYVAAPRNPSHGSVASSPTEREAENDLNNTPKKLPGRPILLLTFGTHTVKTCKNIAAVLRSPHNFLLGGLSAVRTHDLRAKA